MASIIWNWRQLLSITRQLGVLVSEPVTPSILLYYSRAVVASREAGLHRGRNEIEIDFVAGDSSLNRNPDFLYTLFVPDRARTAFPLFDQPDLKASFELTLLIPAAWQAMANSPVDSVTALEDERTEYRFSPTGPISSYLTSY